MTGHDDAEAPDRHDVVASADPYEMFATCKVAASDWAAVAMASEPDDDQALVMQLLADIERDLVAFWAAQGLPTAVGRYRRVDDGPWVLGIPDLPADARVQLAACRHPAEHAQPGSWLARSWELWLCLEEARDGLANGGIHRFGRFMYLLARKQGELATARRRGRAWHAGDKVITGGSNAARAQFENLRPMHDAWLEHDAELRINVPSQHERARIIAQAGGQDRIRCARSCGAEPKKT